jgi:hypothetical protein
VANVQCPVTECDRPRRGSEHVCGACAGQLGRDLGDIPALVDQLEVTLSRQTSGGAGGGNERPLPYDPRASEALDALRTTLVGWTRVLLDGMTRPEGPRCEGCAHPSCTLIDYTTWPRDTLTDMARWLLRRHRSLIRHPAAQEIVEEVGDVVRAAGRVIDRPAERWYAGPCTCGVDLYARVGAVRVMCLACGAEHHIDQRREYLLSSLRDMLATASQAAHILTQLLGSGVVLQPRTVRNWAVRGHIIAKGTDRQGRPLYRVAECEGMFVAELERQAKREGRMSA